MFFSASVSMWHVCFGLIWVSHFTCWLLTRDIMENRQPAAFDAEAHGTRARRKFCWPVFSAIRCPQHELYHSPCASLSLMARESQRKSSTGERSASKCHDPSAANATTESIDSVHGWSARNVFPLLCNYHTSEHLCVRCQYWKKLRGTRFCYTRNKALPADLSV